LALNIFTYDAIDELGDELIRQYLGPAADKAFCVNVEGFVTDYLGLPLVYRAFAEDDPDKMGFISDGKTSIQVYENGTVISKVFPRGTIVIEKFLCRESESGRKRFTIIHEGAHFVLDRALPRAGYHREFDHERRYKPEEFRQMFTLTETMCDRMGAALLMPRFMVRNLVYGYGVEDGIPVYGDNVLRPDDYLLIRRMADDMGASFQAFFIRLRELGFLVHRPLAEYIVKDMGLGKKDEY
jgi:Domain of unknown function (DUF955).